MQHFLNNQKGNYPPRMGKTWFIEEEKELLQEIQKKIPVNLIAEFHERTEGGIRAKLRCLAADMYFQQKLNIIDISKKTSLTISEINDTIKKRELAKERKLANSKENKIKNKNNSELNEVISLLKDIKELLIQHLESN
jgi:hypothetical protein